ncbi:hypothetical protein ACSFVZ_12365 [Pseudoalteromonas sp. SYSU M81236]
MNTYEFMVGMMSGKEQLLLATPPLRTVRASFPAYGSSLYKSVPKYRPAI